jgi:hypothetical protein
VRLTYNILRGASTENLRRLALALKVPDAEALPRALLLSEIEEKLEAEQPRRASSGYY